MAGQLQVGEGSAFGAVRYFWELTAREKEERMREGGLCWQEGFCKGIQFLGGPGASGRVSV